MTVVLPILVRATSWVSWWGVGLLDGEGVAAGEVGVVVAGGGGGMSCCRQVMVSGSALRRVRPETV
ncbi:Uncharacterised protein [Dermatophilus congolensis]|uniref:Uncharacterized protein n=1 Tax=Dermatophilus congolensis TaxID=1863 RepID=A0AA46GZF2_9MICO|nr:Uncharacterised protein [Dermatophilus congolensis]